MHRTKSSLWNTLVKIPTVPAVGWLSSEHFPRSPAAPSVEQPLNQQEPSSHALPFMCLARCSEKDSKEISRTENQQTHIWICPERPFSARGCREKLGLECEDRDWLSNFLANSQIPGFKAAQEPWGGVRGSQFNINKPWMIAYIRIFWFPEWKPEFALMCNSIPMCSLFLTSPFSLLHK